MAYDPNIDPCKMQISDITTQCIGVLEHSSLKKNLNYQSNIDRVKAWDNRTGATSTIDSLNNRVWSYCRIDVPLAKNMHSTIINALGLIITLVDACKTQSGKDSLNLDGPLKALEIIQKPELFKPRSWFLNRKIIYKHNLLISELLEGRFRKSIPVYFKCYYMSLSIL